MPINVIGNSSNNSEQKTDTTLFVQKPYLITNYIEAKIDEDIDLKIQYRNKNLPDPTSIKEQAPKLYVDNLINDPSIIRNTPHIDLNDRNITNIRFLQVSQLPQIDSHLIAKLCVDNAIDEPSSVRNNQDNDFGNYNLTNINSITLNKQAEIDNEVITKAYVDQFHQESERSRRDVGLDFYDESSDLVKNNQDSDFNDNKMRYVDSITVYRTFSSDNKVANKKYNDDSIDESTILRFNQTLENYLKISVGNDTYNLTKFIKIQLTDTKIMKTGSSGAYLQPYWKVLCNDKNINGKISNFINSTKTKSPTSDAVATIPPPIGIAFMCIEKSSNNNGDNVFVSFERTDIIQFTNITFYYNRYTILSDDSKKLMGIFRIQLLLEDNNWSTQYTITKKTQYSDTSTDWTLLNLDFTVENYGIKLIYHQIDTAHADMCLSNLTITHSVY